MRRRPRCPRRNSQIALLSSEDNSTLSPSPNRPSPQKCGRFHLMFKHNMMRLSQNEKLELLERLREKSSKPWVPKFGDPMAPTVEPSKYFFFTSNSAAGFNNLHDLVKITPIKSPEQCLGLSVGSRSGLCRISTSDWSSASPTSTEPTAMLQNPFNRFAVLFLLELLRRNADSLNIVSIDKQHCILLLLLARASQTCDATKKPPLWALSLSYQLEQGGLLQLRLWLCEQPRILDAFNPDALNAVHNLAHRIALR